jgi:hypothetical protein
MVPPKQVLKDMMPPPIRVSPPPMNFGVPLDVLVNSKMPKKDIYPNFLKCRSGKPMRTTHGIK